MTEKGQSRSSWGKHVRLSHKALKGTPKQCSFGKHSMCVEKWLEIVKGSCTVWGKVTAKVSVTSSGEDWEAEMTGLGGAQGGQSDFGFGLT